MRIRRVAPALAWSLVGLLLVVAAIDAVATVRAIDGQRPTEAVLYLAWSALGLTYAVLGAFLVSRLPSNILGWLLMGPVVVSGLGDVLTRDALSSPPSRVTPVLVGQLWFDNFSWVLLIFPVMLMLSLFPSGRLPTPRWRWHPYLIGAMTLAMMFLGAFGAQIGPLEGDWVVDNPIGFLDVREGSTFLTVFNFVWTPLLLVITVGGVAAMVARYRRSGWRERQQIKWLLYAVTVFGLVYVAGAVANEWTTGPVIDLVLIPSMALIPIAIATAILRHRLFDIDVIIRRTVVYVVVIGLLALIFTGSVLAAQGAVRRMTGQESSLAVAASTLLAAAFFNPLRVRIHRTVGRRFFRGGYDLERVVSAFAADVRNETDIDTLTANFVTAVVDTLHPQSIAVSLQGGRPTPGAGTIGSGRSD